MRASTLLERLMLPIFALSQQTQAAFAWNMTTSQLADAQSLSAGVPPTNRKALPAAVPVPEPRNAEFAIRWDPAEGGPKSAQEVYEILGTSLPSPERYAVRYFDLPRPSSAPANASIILRERTKIGGKTQIRLKYRLEQPIAGPWACPSGNTFEQEDEVDISFLANGKLTRVYSYSCTVKADAPPASLAAVPKRCSGRMTRYEWNGVKVEEWFLPRGKVQLEVSRSSANTEEQLLAFQQVSLKLMDKGVKPSDRSKSGLGSVCP